MGAANSLAILAAALLPGSCASPAVGPVTPPSWLGVAYGAEQPLRISQSAFLDGPRIRVCRRIENVSSQGVVIYNVQPEGDDSQQLSIAFYDRAGAWIEPWRPPGGVYHPGFVPPPSPAYEGDISIYRVLRPGDHADNCKTYDIERGHGVFQVVTYYSPIVAADLVPSSFAAGKLLMTNAFAFASPPCVVNVARRHVECVRPVPPAALGAGKGA